MSQPVADPERDVSLVAALALGDRGALAELYDRHASAMLGVALRVLHSRSDAEDLLHDVFVEAWQRAGAYEAGRGSVRSWLLVRVRSRGIDRLRSLEAARRHGMLPAAVEPGPVASVAPLWDGPDHARARAALDDLPEAQRTLVELAYFEGLTCSEMAARCGIPIGTVKSRLATAMSRLRASVAADGRALG